MRIEELNIPGMGDFDAFWKQGYAFLQEHLNTDDDGDLVVIGTRSILILLLNILLRDTTLKGKHYTVFDFDTCGVSMLQHLGELNAELLFHNQTSFLF